MAYLPASGDVVVLSEIHPGEVDYEVREFYENQIYVVKRMRYTESGVWVHLETVFGEPVVRHFKYSLVTLTPIATVTLTPIAT